MVVPKHQWLSTTGLHPHPIINKHVQTELENDKTGTMTGYA